jgi:hypothetical protein
MAAMCETNVANSVSRMNKSQGKADLKDTLDCELNQRKWSATAQQQNGKEHCYEQTNCLSACTP